LQARPAAAGRAVFAFQPAEEGPGGARPMIEAGILEDNGVEAVFGLHLWSELPLGKIGVTAGPAMASADEFEIRVLGRGGHAAFPQNTVDAVVVGSHLVTALQTLISRNADPMQTSVLTVGSFQAGSAFNIIAEEAVLRGTLRTFDPNLRAHLVRRLRETAEGVTGAFGAQVDFRFLPHYPPTVNDPAMAEFTAEIAAGVVGAENVVRDLVMMGAEDFSFFLRRRPGCFFFVGAGSPERGCGHPHHSPRFDFDEDALPIGCEMFLRIAERYFERFPAPPPAPVAAPWD
jgi:amidohydrolase